MTRLVLLRHGETVWNSQKRHIGVTDLDLSEKGRAQARALAKSLESMSFAKVYSSALKRSLQTAAELCRSRSIEPEVAEGLNEINFGRWEGLTWPEVKEAYGDVYQDWLAGDEDFSLPDGENWGEFKSRVSKAFEPVIAENIGQTVAVVGHGAVIKTALCIYTGFGLGPFFRLYLSPASISVMDTDGRKAVVSVLNDTCHLDEDLRTDIIRF